MSYVRGQIKDIDGAHVVLKFVTSLCNNAASAHPIKILCVPTEQTFIAFHSELSLAPLSLN